MLSCSDPKTTRSSIALGVEKKIQKKKKKRSPYLGETELDFDFILMELSHIVIQTNLSSTMMAKERKKAHVA